MKYMTKEDISKYLFDYYIIMNLISNNPDKKIIDIYAEYMYKNNREQEYEDNSYYKMINLNITYNNLRIFSYIKDFIIDKLDDSELDFDNIKEDLFVNKDDAKKFSKKQIVTFIRNAFNHNDGLNELYKISENGNKVEINMIVPKSNQNFHIILDGNKLQTIYKGVCESNNKYLYSYYDIDNVDISKLDDINELNKIKYCRYYFTSKLTKQVKQDLEHNNEYETKNNIENRVNNVFSSNNFNNYYKYEYSLSNEQKNKIIEMFSDVDLKEILPIYLKGFLLRTLHDITPDGMYRLDQTSFESQYLIWFMTDYYLSYNDINKYLDDIIYGKRENVIYDDIEEDRYNYLKKCFEINNNEIKINMILLKENVVNRQVFQLITYLSFVSGIYDAKKNPNVIINGTNIETRHIRNSLAHGRWFIGTDYNLEMYDRANGINNDYNFNWHEEVEISELVKIFDNKNNLKSKKMN